MSTVVTRFEVELPFSNVGDTIDNAVQNFKSSMRLLCDLYEFNVYKTTKVGVTSQSNFMSGYLLSSQTSQALINLNTLNNALVTAGSTTILCSSWNVTLQP